MFCFCSFIISLLIENKLRSFLVGAMTFCQLDISSTCHFVNLTFCQLAISSTWHFVNLPFHQLDIWSTWHFVNLTFCQLDILSTCHFVNMTFRQLDFLSTYFLNERETIEVIGWGDGSLPGLTLSQCYKTFYGCSLRILVISEGFCPLQAFPACLLVRLELARVKYLPDVPL
jgi:hypothetical protein